MSFRFCVQLRLRYETEAYRQFLAQRKAEEARMERELDELIQRELDKVNSEQDKKRDREQKARQNLMQEVQQARYQQLAEKGKRIHFFFSSWSFPCLASPLVPLSTCVDLGS